MSRMPESFVGWVKRHVESIEAAPAERRVCNLSTSGVHTAANDTWFERVCGGMLPEVVEHLNGCNEYGLPGLKTAIRKRYGIPEDREILLTAGASDAFRLICESLFAGKPGCEVLVESPTYQPLSNLPSRYGALVVPAPVPIKRAPGAVAEAIGRLVRPSTTAVVLSNLHNPTGSLLARDELRELVRAVTKISPGISIVVDETFLGLGPEPFRTGCDVDPCIITVSSLTKTFGLGALRCGWVVADKTRYPRLAEDWVTFEGIGSKILEVLSLVAFEQLDDLLAESRKHLDANRALLIAGTEQLRRDHLLEGEVPAFGCVYFAHSPKQPCFDLAATRLRDEFGVLVAPGRFFGESCANCLRIGFGGTAESVREGCERLTRGLRALV
jgi:aspartate/methionine/tyrosine aminotransferase